MPSPLEQARVKYVPSSFKIIQEIRSFVFQTDKREPLVTRDDKISKLFPKTGQLPFVQAKIAEARDSGALRIGVVFSGGQASGGHNVIAGLFDALVKLHPASKLFGFLNGPSGIIEGKTVEIAAELLAPYRNQGGFDLIGSGRTKIETGEQLDASLISVQRLSLDGLVIIGGDDSNTNAALLAEFFLTKGLRTRVIGVPKTIDGDLKNPYVATSFGFDTACKVYSEMIGNIQRDCLSAKKYYHFIKLMGRSASHIALECALSTQPNYTLIAEEVAASRKTLAQITSELADLICQRAELGKNYGVILIPEGLIEFIPEVKELIKELNSILAKTASTEEKQIFSQLSSVSQACFESLPEQVRKQLLFTRDPHGNVQVSLIETDQLLAISVGKELQKRKNYKGKFHAQCHFFGYEGRASLPSNFDCNYCYALGAVSALLVKEGLSGYMAYIQKLHLPVSEWEMGGVPFTALMRLEIRKDQEKPVITKALVDLKGKAFAKFSKLRGEWMAHDPYRYPGPIQFAGGVELTDSLPISVVLETQ